MILCGCELKSPVWSLSNRVRLRSYGSYARKTYDDDMSTLCRLVARKPRQLPGLCDPMRTRNIVAFTSGGVHVRVEDLDLAKVGHVDADAADRLAGEKVALDEVERVTVERVRTDPRRHDRMSRQNRKA